MKKLSWKFRDRKGWGDGPWNNEPDKIQWIDKMTGMPCLAVRNSFGAWCGYVGIDRKHPMYGMPYDSLDIFNVHGGLTYAEFCVEDNKEHGICHLTEPGDNDAIYWLGFDCAHAFDKVPGMETPFKFAEKNMEYRDIDYVRNECEQLAFQLMQFYLTHEEKG